MAIDTVIHTNQYSIDRVLKAGVPVLLVFWRPDARPSTELDSTLSDLAARFAGKAIIAKIHAGEEETLVRRYGVRALPTLVFVKNGEVVAQAAGAAQAGTLEAWLRYLVEGGSRPALPTGPTVPLQEPARATAGAAAGQPQPRTSSRPTRQRPRQPAGPQAPANGKPITLTDANFQQIINGPQPVLVDFWAPWCGPCNMVAPAVEQLAQEFQGRAVVGKLNVDENQRTAQQYQIMSIPALYIFKNGQVVDRLIGVQPLAALRQHLARHVN